GAGPLLLPDLGKMAAAAAASTSGFYAIVAAMRIGDATAQKPYRYSRPIFSLMILIAVFAARPDALTLAGAALILPAAFVSSLRGAGRIVLPLRPRCA